MWGSLFRGRMVRHRHALASEIATRARPVRPVACLIDLPREQPVSHVPVVGDAFEQEQGAYAEGEPGPRFCGLQNAAQVAPSVAALTSPVTLPLVGPQVHSLWLPTTAVCGWRPPFSHAPCGAYSGLSGPPLTQVQSVGFGFEPPPPPARRSCWPSFAFFFKALTTSSPRCLDTHGRAYFTPTIPFAMTTVYQPAYSFRLLWRPPPPSPPPRPPPPQVTSTNESRFGYERQSNNRLLWYPPTCPPCFCLCPQTRSDNYTTTTENGPAIQSFICRLGSRRRSAVAALAPREGCDVCTCLFPSIECRHVKPQVPQALDIFKAKFEYFGKHIGVLVPQ